MQAVIRVGHNCLPALEVCTQHKWMALHPGDYGPGLHSILETKQEDKDQKNTRGKINGSSVFSVFFSIQFSSELLVPEMPAIEMCGLHDMMKLHGFSVVALRSLSLPENHDGE